MIRWWDLANGKDESGYMIFNGDHTNMKLYSLPDDFVDPLPKGYRNRVFRSGPIDLESIAWNNARLINVETIFLDIPKINGDAAFILPQLPDESVDLIFTDPPYDFTPDQKMFFHYEFMRISKTGAIVFYPPENPWWFPIDQHLFWIKPISTKNTSKRYSRFVEEIGIYNGARNVKWNPGRHWSQYTNVFTDIVDDATLHAFRKPPSLIERIILNHTDPGDLILDPFAGSFVIADVANRLGRNCVSIELNKDLYERYGKK